MRLKTAAAAAAAVGERRRLQEGSVSKLSVTTSLNSKGSGRFKLFDEQIKGCRQQEQRGTSGQVESSGKIFLMNESPCDVFSLNFNLTFSTFTLTADVMTCLNRQTP